MPTEKQDSTAGAAAVPEAGARDPQDLSEQAIAELERTSPLALNNALALVAREKLALLIAEVKRRRALSSPSGDAREPEDEREDCPARLLVERSVYYCTLNAGHKRLHHEAHGGGGLIVSWVDDLSENQSPVAPSIPEEPKAASQKEGGDDAER